jgi:hypothetical protein
MKVKHFKHPSKSLFYIFKTIWLNLPMDDRHFGYIAKLTPKNKNTASIVFLVAAFDVSRYCACLSGFGIGRHCGIPGRCCCRRRRRGFGNRY